MIVYKISQFEADTIAKLHKDMGYHELIFDNTELKLYTKFKAIYRIVKDAIEDEDCE